MSAAAPPILLARPRGFCAGVERAIEIVELALAVHGAPVYVRHAIVHNQRVLERLAARGARYVEDVTEVPAGALVVFSAHGVAPAVWRQAAARGLRVIDATCPLVAKVHAEALRFARDGCEILLVGHRGHAEVAGTLGYVPHAGQVVASTAEAERVAVRDPQRVAVLTQTTMSVDDAAAIVAVLRARFPALREPRRADICYATQNRQAAVKALARRADLVLIAGDPRSSNANRLVEVARAHGARARLVADAAGIEEGWLRGGGAIGVSAAASTPEELVVEIVARLRDLGCGGIEELVAGEEDEFFPVPDTLRRAALRAGRSAA